MLEDGTIEVTPDDEKRFVEWLEANGATFPKIAWPARTTVGGVRGTVALEDIETGEHMLCIPYSLMISPPLCRSFPPLREVFETIEMFRTNDDLVIALFIMHERIAGPDSFWYPYLKILPYPGSIADWNAAELAELQNEHLIEEASRRNIQLGATYKRVFDALSVLRPGQFPRELYTEALFLWAHKTVAARAFGRRLSWNALVPFADCLNHSNVQTKYDFNVDGNQTFRLFPTGSNRYPKGTEVFNSYGRRDNRHLLMEYGFAIEDNEWETFLLQVTLDARCPHYAEKRALLVSAHQPLSKYYRIRYGALELNVVSQFRISSSEIATDLTADGLLRLLTGPKSLASEIAALQSLRAHYLELLAAYPTSVEQDDEIRAAGVPSPRLSVCISYRITQKHILQQQVDALSAVLQLCSREGDRDALLAGLRSKFESAHVSAYLFLITALVDGVDPDTLLA